MKKKVLCFIVTVLIAVFSFGCNSTPKKARIGASFGVGVALRWQLEKKYMEEKAAELGADIEVRLNTTNTPKTQKEDCVEMIDSGIDVLVLIPRNVYEAGEIINYAKSKNVKVISYARSVLGDKVDLFVGYDSLRLGQSMGQFLSEKVFAGNYIFLKGDDGDHNATLIYNGAMLYLNPLRKDINVILDASVPGWQPAEAKKMVKQAIVANNNKIDAILAPNDKIAEVCAEVLNELNITEHVAITGMDAELSAVRRIVKGTQDMTLYLDLKELAFTAINEANNMAKNLPVNINSEFDNQSGNVIPANLTTGKVITNKNIDKILIETGFFTKEEVYE